MTNTLEIDVIGEEQYQIRLPRFNATVRSYEIEVDTLGKCVSHIFECDRLTYDLPREYQWVVEVSGGVATISHQHAT